MHFLKSEPLCILASLCLLSLGKAGPAGVQPDQTQPPSTQQPALPALGPAMEQASQNFLPCSWQAAHREWQLEVSARIVCRLDNLCFYKQSPPL